MNEKEPTEVEQEKQPDAEKNALEGKSASELIDIIRETRTEAKDRRLKAKELEEKLSAIEAERQKQEQDKKIEQGKLSEVVEELKNKLAEKDKEFEPVKQKAEKYDEYDKSKRETLKGTLGNKWLNSFETMPLLDLETLASHLTSSVKLPDSDNGKNKKDLGSDYFTMDEIKKMSPEQLRDKDLLEKVNKSLAFHGKK